MTVESRSSSVLFVNLSVPVRNAVIWCCEDLGVSKEVNTLSILSRGYDSLTLSMLSLL